MDKIHIYAKDNDKILELMKNHKEEIMSEVLPDDEAVEKLYIFYKLRKC